MSMATVAIFRSGSGDNLVLCTPTLVSKGFMKPDDMCIVDMDGNQKAGTKKTDQRGSDASANHESSAPRQGCRPLSTLPTPPLLPWPVFAPPPA